MPQSKHEVVKIRYSNSCMESDPCQHETVTLIYADGRRKKLGWMDGDEIAHLYQKHHLKTPKHFAEYNTRSYE